MTLGVRPCRCTTPSNLKARRILSFLEPRTSCLLVPVEIHLVRAFDFHADVVGLGLRQSGEVDAELFEVQACDLFVEDFRERVDNAGFVLEAGNGLLAVCAEPQVHLGDGLVREGGTHHEARVAGGAAEVQ